MNFLVFLSIFGFYALTREAYTNYIISIGNFLLNKGLIVDLPDDFKFRAKISIAAGITILLTILILVIIYNRDGFKGIKRKLITLSVAGTLILTALPTTIVAVCKPIYYREVENHEKLMQLLDKNLEIDLEEADRVFRGIADSVDEMILEIAKETVESLEHVGEAKEMLEEKVIDPLTESINDVK